MSLRNLTKQDSYFLVRYVCDGNMQVRRRGLIRETEEIDLTQKYIVQWGRSNEFDEAEILARGSEQEMCQAMKSKQPVKNKQPKKRTATTEPTPGSSSTSTPKRPKTTPVVTQKKQRKPAAPKSKCGKKLASVVGTASPPDFYDEQPSQTTTDTIEEQPPQTTTDTSEEQPPQTTTNTSEEQPPQTTTNTGEELPQTTTNTIEELPQTTTSEELPQTTTNTIEELPQSTTNTIEELPQTTTNTIEELPQITTNTIEEQLPQTTTNTSDQLPQTTTCNTPSTPTTHLTFRRLRQPHIQDNTPYGAILTGMKQLSQQIHDNHRKTETRLDGISRRLDTVTKQVHELKVTSRRIETKVDLIIEEAKEKQQTQPTQPTQPNHAPIPHDTTEETAMSPETYRVPMEKLKLIHKESTGPGNFAARCTREVFPELFGPANKRFQYNWNGGGKLNKTELPSAGKDEVKSYVLHFHPEARNTTYWKDTVVPKINEVLRRSEKKPTNPQYVQLQSPREPLHPIQPSGLCDPLQPIHTQHVTNMAQQTPNDSTMNFSFSSVLRHMDEDNVYDASY